MTKSKLIKNKIKNIFLIVIGIFLGLFLQYAINTNPNIEIIKDKIKSIIENNNKDQTNEFEQFTEIDKILNKGFFEQSKLLTGKMLQSAVKAYVDSIDDPYTTYMDAELQSGFDSMLKGEDDFEGIGAVVRKKDYYVLIEEILKDSPAFNAGLKPLDRIVFVNTGSVKDLTINEAVNKIKGPKGTTVRLIIERFDRKDNSKKEILEIEVVREKLIIPSVSSKILTGSDNKVIGYINISIIGEETENIFKKEVAILKSNQIDGIILDLRGNGGGFLPIAVQIASHFIPKNTLIVSTKYRIRNEESYKSIGYGDLEGLPVVVLINEMTASAGEIISLALQEQIGAKILGMQSFGKGSIQTLEKLNNGDSIKYTIGKWYSPSGKNIDNIGVTPDIEIKLDIDEYIDNNIDNQLLEAKETLIDMINYK